MRRAVPLLVLAVLLLGASPSTAAVFDPDPAFDGDGVVLNRGNAGVVAAPDGGVWIASYSGLSGGDLLVERRKPDGTLDPSWGAGGVVNVGTVLRPVVGGTTTLAPAIVPNAIGGVDVTFSPVSASGSLYVRRLTAVGNDLGDSVFNTTVPYTPTGFVVPDGDGLAMAANGFDQVLLTRVGPNGLLRGSTSLPELPSNQVVGLTRLADGTLVVASGDLTGDKVVKLSARRPDLSRPAAFDAPPTLSSATFGGLTTTAGGRVVGGGENGSSGALLEGRSGTTGALDPGFGAAGLLTLPPLGAVPILHRVTSVTPYGTGLVVRSIQGSVAGEAVEIKTLLTLLEDDGTVRAGPRSIGTSASLPLYNGMPASAAPSLNRVYVVQTDPDAAFVANVVALKTVDEAVAPPPAPPSPPATTPTTTPTTPLPPAPPAAAPLTITKVAAARGGTVKLTVRAAVAGDLVVTASGKAGRRTLRWGPVASSFRAPATRTVTIRPSAAVGRVLARRGARLKATFSVRFVPSTGTRAQLTRTATLRGTR